MSKNQFEAARKKIKKTGLEDQCQVLLCDYCDLEEVEAYDKIASIGVFKHVGLKNTPLYFGAIQRLLKTQGRVLNHGITTTDVKSLCMGLGAGKFIDTLRVPQWRVAAFLAERLVGERRYRIWQIYLAGCAYGFSRGWMNLYQVLCSKADNHALQQHPLTRDYMYAPACRYI